jgi:hypothetical protein
MQVGAWEDAVQLRIFGLLCGVSISAMLVGCGFLSTHTAPPATLAVTTTSSLTAGTASAVYSLTLAVTGGTAPYTWSVISGSLPAGLSLSAAGVLSGTPTTAGTYTFTIQVVDSSTTPQTATLTATIVINPVPLTITTTSPLTNGTLNTPYIATFTATGGTAPYNWSVSSGSLPSGLTLTSTGILSGTPAVSGSYSFTIRATDSAASPQNATKPILLQIEIGTLTVATTSLPSGNVGSAYVFQLAASGGVPPYAWSLGTGPLPAGLALSSTGGLSGTPSSAGGSSPTFSVTDSASHQASTSLPLTIHAATGTIPDGQYTFVFAGTAPQGTPPSPNGVAINGTFSLQSGEVSGGYFDENTNTNPALVEQPITGGSLTNGANGLGQLVLTTASGSMTFALATPASASSGGETPIRIIEFDDATGSGSRGSGVLKAASANPTAAAISGNYAFLFSGTDIEQNQQALVCSFQTDGAGNIPNGKADANQFGGELAIWSTLSGSYNVDANGRGVLTIVLDGGSFHFSFYQVSPVEWLAISLDPATLDSPLVSGSVFQQASGQSFTTASLPAVSVVQISGVQPISGGTTPDITLGLASSDGSGNVVYSFDEYAGALTTGGSLSVAYAVDPVTGRAVSTGATPEPVLYIINSTSAFYLGADRPASSGILEAQTGAPFTNGSFSGNYLGGSLSLVMTSALNEDGLAAADGSGNIALTTNRSSEAGLVSYQNVVGTYAVDIHGRVVSTTPDGVTRIFYVISPTKVAYLTSDGGGYLGSFAQ